MAIESKELPLGSSCPFFSLPSVNAKQYTLQDFAQSKGLLIAFICNHCPYVKAIEDRLIGLASAFSIDEFQLVGICSNDPGNYPEDAPEELLKRWQRKNYGFVYLVDESQEVARKFGAACTPDLFLYDKNRKLYYHGRLDDSWRDASQVKKEELKNAIKALLRDEPAPTPQNHSIGCSIKWKN